MGVFFSFFPFFFKRQKHEVTDQHNVSCGHSEVGSKDTGNGHWLDEFSYGLLDIWTVWHFCIFWLKCGCMFQPQQTSLWTLTPGLIQGFSRAQWQNSNNVSKKERKNLLCVLSYDRTDMAALTFPLPWLQCDMQFSWPACRVWKTPRQT